MIGSVLLLWLALAANAAVPRVELGLRPSPLGAVASALGGVRVASSPLFGAASTAPRATPAPLPASFAVAHPLVERVGRDSFGHEVVVLDVLDAKAPEQGTIAHVDFSVSGDQAQLNQPLDSWTEKTPGLDHFREHLWFGLAVLPKYRGLGLGARLLAEAMDRMRARGARTLYIRATETSVSFYRARLGDRIVSEEIEPVGEDDKLIVLEVDLTR